MSLFKRKTMNQMSFGNSNELVSNYIEAEVMLSHFLNWHRHDGHAEWVAEHRIKVVPDAQYHGTWYVESAIVGGLSRLTREEALGVVHSYESQTDPDISDMNPGDFEWHLRLNRWDQLGASPEHF